MVGQNQGGGNVDLFDTYFRRADLDQDGRISGAEAVDFFQGSNLSQQVLAQIWMHADHSLTGFLGRLEFYNALKLVTVAQSKRDLTPDMVKAALYSPASAKIPAPKINLAVTPAPQVISSPSAPVPQVNLMSPSLPQMGAVAQMPSQNFGFRGQVPPNSGMSQEYFPSQGNQLNRPPVPMPSGTGLRPPQGVSGPNLPGAGSTLSSSNLSTDWFGARTGGAPTGATSQVPNRGISPPIPSAGQKPPDPFSTSSLMAAKDPKLSVGSGNGLVSNSLFGGDMFSVNQFVPKQASSAATYSASSAPASLAIVSVTSGSQPSPKLDPPESLSAFTRQSTGGQVPPTQSVSAQSNTSLGSSRVSLDAGNSTSSQPQSLWPKMTRVGIQRYHKVFVEVDTDRDGKISGEQAHNLFMSWRLPREVLKQVWDLSDQDNDIMLSLREFCVALYLMERYREGQPLPETLPNSIILDQTLLSLAGPPNASYETATWGSSPGLRPGMPGALPMTPAALRPPAQAGFPQPDGTMQFNHQKARSPLMENSQATQLSNGEHNSTDLNFEAESETDNKVENKEKMILDSKEKMVFYREKMQDLVLFKSRCDNRLNEITERAIADKHEAELLGKKYEEKYKQVAEIASKLTIEEASFRDIQERKMEYHQAIIKMEQGGSADGILQVRADRIQSDLEELLKALTERCKKHGVHVKSAALIELPHGWQPGIPEVSAVWNEEWDKFDEEGFSFDVAVSMDAVSPRKELSSPTNSFSPDSFSNADDKSE